MARASDPIAAELIRLVQKLGLDGVIVDPCDPSTARALVRGAVAGGDPLAGLSELRLVVDLTESNSLATVICEAALRLNIPRLAFQRGALASGLHQFATSLYPTSLARLFNTVARCAADDEVLGMLRAEASREAVARFSADSGWTVLWRILTHPDGTELGGDEDSDPMAELWG